MQHNLKAISYNGGGGIKKHWHIWRERHREREDCHTSGQHKCHNAQYLTYYSFKHCITYSLRMQSNWIRSPNPNGYATYHSTQYHTSYWNTAEHRIIGYNANKLETKFKLSTLLTFLMYFPLPYIYIYIHTYTYTHTHMNVSKEDAYWIPNCKRHAGN